MILVACRPGLRASEICELRWEDLNFGGATLNVSRKKSGMPSTHPRAAPAAEAARVYGLHTFSSMSAARPSITRRFQLAGQARRSEGQTAFPNPRAHAAPCGGLYPGQRWQGYPLDPSLFRPQGHQAYGAIHRIVADAVQKLLSRLTTVVVGLTAITMAIERRPVSLLSAALVHRPAGHKKRRACVDARPLGSPYVRVFWTG
jgi:hypothetical protein